MTAVLSRNAQAILLLTAPLLAGRGGISPDLLSPGEYKRLARHLRELQRQPADLVAEDASELLGACHSVIDEERLKRLLGRGFLLSQVVEKWQSRAIWVVSRADADYPRRLKARLRDDAPAVLYGCGERALLESGGLAVVGSRNADEALIEYTRSVGRLAARAGRTVVSGGAKGIDLAAMRGALEAGGTASGVLADSLERTAMIRENRNLLVEGQLVLISPYDPNAGFHVGQAMQRNKIIYALADRALVVNADANKGGSWSGAVEQLDKLKLVPVFVRSTGAPSPGLEGLTAKGALPWPNPDDVASFEAMFEESTPATEKAPAVPELAAHAIAPDAGGMKWRVSESSPEPATGWAGSSSAPERAPLPPAELLFAAASEAILSLLTKPMTEAEVAAALDVSTAQAKAWLVRMTEKGMLEKRKRPVGYVVADSRLL